MAFHLYNLFFNSARTSIVYPLLLASACWLIWRRKIHARFFLDPVGGALVIFLGVGILSNVANDRPATDLMQAVWFLYPYYWGKYLVSSNAMRPEAFCRMFIAFATIFAMAFIFGHYALGLDSLAGKDFIRSDGRFVFTFKYPVRVGLYLGTAVLFCLHFLMERGLMSREGWLWAVDAVCLFPFCILKSQDRTTFALLGAWVTALLVSYRKVRLLIVLGFVGAALVLSLGLTDRMLVRPADFWSSPAMLYRYSFWEVSLRLFCEQPLLGHGYGSFSDLYRPYVDEHRETLLFTDIDPDETATHNMNLSLLAQTGLLGFLAMNAAFFFTIWGFWRYRSRDPILWVLMLTVAYYYMAMQMNVFLHSHHSNKLVFLVMGLVGGRLFSGTGNGGGLKQDDPNLA